MTTARIKLLQTKYELVIPQGINYGVIPREYWEQLMIFEKKIYPFMVVQSRMAPIVPDTPREIRTTAGRETYQRIAQRTPRYEKQIEMITVDTKTFHCTLGALFDLKRNHVGEVQSPDQWATMAARELYDGYRKQYKGLKTAGNK